MRKVQFVRRFCTQNFAIKHEPNKLQFDPKEGRSNSIREAERVVGYSTSFLNLRWLLNDEIANIALYLKKISGTEHPLLKIAKDVLFKSHRPPWGLIVLLVSKAGGYKKEVLSIDHDITAGILHSQRVLAEVTEMVRTGYLVHNGVISFDKQQDTDDILHYGNKLALLSGDYLLSKSFSDLSSLRNQKVNYIISTAIRDFAESAFLLCGQVDRTFPLPFKPCPTKRKSKYCCDFTGEKYVNYGPYKIEEILGHPIEEWTLRTVLSGGNLLGKSCRAALLLSGHDKKAQENGYLLGKHLALAWQAFFDSQEFLEGKLNLLGAPVMFVLDESPELYVKLENAEELEVQQSVCDLVRKGDALEKTKELQEEFSRRALVNLEYFDDSDAKESLRRLILAF